MTNKNGRLNINQINQCALHLPMIAAEEALEPAFERWIGMAVYDNANPRDWKISTTKTSQGFWIKDSANCEATYDSNARTIVNKSPIFLIIGTERMNQRATNGRRTRPANARTVGLAERWSMYQYSHWNWNEKHQPQ